MSLDLTYRISGCGEYPPKVKLNLLILGGLAAGHDIGLRMICGV